MSKVPVPMAIHTNLMLLSIVCLGLPCGAAPVYATNSDGRPWAGMGEA